MKYTPASSVLLALTIAACSGGSGELETSTAGLSPGSANPSLAGTFHREENSVDSVNLVIREDGTFEWSIDGCDFSGGNCGAWERDGSDAIVLEPSGGSEFSHFGWIGDSGATCGKSLRVVATKDGSGVDITEDDGTVHTWKRGGVCALCRGSEGPNGQEACEVPFESACTKTTNPNRSCD